MTVSPRPQFPNFKPVQLADREVIHSTFQSIQPRLSELTFTNLFMWRHYYRFQWCMHGEHLIAFSNPLGWGYALLPPAGPDPRLAVAAEVMEWLRSEKEDGFNTCIERADESLAEEARSHVRFTVEPVPDHFDYVYRSQDLIELKGRKYHKKKNHFNRFVKRTRFEYRPLTEALIPACIQVLKEWCDWKECDKCPFIRAEFEAVHEALLHFKPLELDGGAILIDGRVKAFSLGEMLNRETAVIHAEKTDPTIPELFTVINQQFCQHRYADAAFINREQDLGQEGLRKAKHAYHPDHMVKKHRICLKH